MRIGIVNDSQIAIEALRQALSCSPEHQVIWVAHHGAEAVKYCAEDTPDLILMDLFMPVMDGVESIRRIMRDTPCPILVVTSTVSHQSVRVFEALCAGALDVIKTPRLFNRCNEEGAKALLKKIQQIKILTEGSGEGEEKTSKKKHSTRICLPQNYLLAIGASTGGPQAIAQVLSHLPPWLPASVVVVQHMDPEFIPGLARWLNIQIKLPVKLAQTGMRPMKGTVLLAGSQGHLVLTSKGTFSYIRASGNSTYTPSVDLFFKSVAEHWRGEAIGVLLTGIGHDGAKGLLALRQQGWHTIAQDQTSSAIYGMPKAAVEISAAREVLPLQSIGPALVKRLGGDVGHERPHIVTL